MAFEVDEMGCGEVADLNDDSSCLLAGIFPLLTTLDIFISPWPPLTTPLPTRGPVDTGTKPSDVENKVTVSAFARRRLAVVMVRLKMAETVADVSVNFRFNLSKIGRRRRRCKGCGVERWRFGRDELR